MYPLFYHSAILLTSLASIVQRGASSDPESICKSPSGEVRRQLWTNLHPSDISTMSVAVFPVGSIEHHGPHLPFGTDLLLAESVVKHAVAEMQGVAVLPVTPFGASFEHNNLAGTIPVQDGTLNGLWDDVLTGLIRSGLRKIVIVNAHGGQTQNVEIAIRRSRFRHEALVVSFNVQAMLTKAWKKVETRHRQLQTESVYGIHGGLIETAVMIYLFPDLVKTSEAEDFRPKRTYYHLLQPHGDVVSFGWRSEDLSKSGALGDAKSANADIGAKIFDETVTELRKLVLELLETKLEDVLSPSHVQTSGWGEEGG